MELIETYDHEGQGYNPFLVRDGLQVAFLNYAEEESLEAIRKLDVHHMTDEAFFLVKGEVLLICADIENGISGYDIRKMEYGTVYNVPANVWHKVAMKPGSSVLIVEKSGTHERDFEFYDMSEKERRDLVVLAKSV